MNWKSILAILGKRWDFPGIGSHPLLYFCGWQFGEYVENEDKGLEEGWHWDVGTGETCNAAQKGGISCLHLPPLLRRRRPIGCHLRPASCLCFWTLSSTCQTSPRTFSWVTQKLELCRPCRLQNAVFKLQTSMILKRELMWTSQGKFPDSQPSG